MAGISLSGSICARNTTVSCASPNTRGAAIMQNKTTAHSLFMDFLRVFDTQGVRDGRSLARAPWNCTYFDIPPSPPRRGGVAAPSEAKAQTGWSDRPKYFPELTTPAFGHPSSARRGMLSFHHCSRSAVPHPGCKRDEHAGHDRTQESRRIRTLDTVPQCGKDDKSGCGDECDHRLMSENREIRQHQNDSRCGAQNQPRRYRLNNCGTRHYKSGHNQQNRSAGSLRQSEENSEQNDRLDNECRQRRKRRRQYGKESGSCTQIPPKRTHRRYHVPCQRANSSERESKRHAGRNVRP